uniref:NADH-ubiquinone oxidoreductase chain 6 n=1 Tax=Echinoecus nipponicus TaxID=2305783 RepID=A0A346Q1B2_9EUCA|nr:NADH dehydrogenase subunit 6 [Echinoecus nipponicus]AXR86897.1 NADH dehydrogenase subunit 6 [Echinoecus nipponicus]
MTLLTIPLTLIFSLLFSRLSHPLSLGLTLLLQTVTISITSGIYTPSYWFSYILFMIFLGGMLVLFIYVASLASNEPFSFSLTTFSAFSTLFIILTVIILMSDPVMNSHTSTLAISSINHINLLTPSTISWIYNSPSMLFTLFIITYLLLTLLVVVKITNLFKGPLRLLN